MSSIINSAQWVPPSLSVPYTPTQWNPVSSVPSFAPSSSSTQWNPVPSVPSFVPSVPVTPSQPTQWNPAPSVVPSVPSSSSTQWNSVPSVPSTSSSSSTQWNPSPSAPSFIHPTTPSQSTQWNTPVPTITPRQTIQMNEQGNRSQIFRMEEDESPPIAPVPSITTRGPSLPITPDLRRLVEHKLHPMLCLEHLGTPGIGEVRGIVTDFDMKTNNFSLRTIDGKDYTMIYNKFLPVRTGDYVHALAKMIAPFNLEIVAHPTVFTPRSGQDIENLIKQKFGKYNFPTVQFMRRLQELADNKNLVDFGVDEELHPIESPVDVLDYLSQQHQDGNSMIHLFEKSSIEAKKLKMLLEFWNDSIILRRLYLLGFNRKQIRELHMKPAQLHASIIFNPYTVPGLTMTRCYELDICTGRMAKIEEARAGEILRAVHANTYKKGWNATTETWLLRRYSDLPQYIDLLQKYYHMVFEEIVHYKDTYTECTEEIQDPDLGLFNYNGSGNGSDFSLTEGYPSKREQLIRIRVCYLKKQYMAEKMLALYLQARLAKGKSIDFLSEDDINCTNLNLGKGKSRDSSNVPIVNTKDNKLEKLKYDQEQDRKKSAADFRKQTITTKGPVYNINIDPEQINSMLDEQQKQAVLTALRGGVSIITGPPGSGKTYCIREICRLLTLNSVPYMLTSFVGKAVSRIREVVCQGVGKTPTLQPTGVGSEVASTEEEEPETTEKKVETVWMSDVNPATLHSMITRQEKPFFRVLIIDESSMLELGLLYDFMSVYGTNYGIIFVGDANQLPPIGPGSLFNEMIKSRVIPKTVLSTYHRLDDGTDSDALLNNLRSIVRWKENLPYLFAQGDNFQILDGESEQVYPLLIFLSQQGYKKDDICIICPYRKYSENINQICQLFWNSDQKHIVEPNGRTWYIGDNVLFLTNSKEHSVYNGEKGVILDSEPAGLFSQGEEATQGLKGVKVNFGQGRICILPISLPSKKQNNYSNVGTTYVDEDGKTQVYTSDDVVMEDESDKITTKDIELAYCLTVHKSQGSEYPVVIFIMPVFASAEQRSFINRNMIYTGISRARERVIHIGNIMTTTFSIGNKLSYRSEYLSDRLLKVLPRIYEQEKIEELTKYEEDPDESFDPDDQDW